MDIDKFLDDLRGSPDYAGQIVYVHEEARRKACLVDPAQHLAAGTAALLKRIGFPRLYRHQAEAMARAASGGDVLVATGTASGKSLCYAVPILDRLRSARESRALLLFPTKALCQDQFGKFSRMLDVAGLSDRLAGVFDGDTPSALRRRLRDHGSVIFTNPDMLHAALMPQHGRWAGFLGSLDFLVLDELHVYSGLFGANMAHLLTRFLRLCRHYGSAPQITACSATVANPRELAETLTGRSFDLIDRDGSPRGRRVIVFWNPPRIRETHWRSRRSANVEAHELMARLVARDIPVITFSKAKMTAEMIYRYVCDKLRDEAPQKAGLVTPYRGGYLPQERRDIEQRLFSGDLIGVSTTPALELGIDVGGLDACILVGYPGTLASFYQQAGRAGRKERDSVVFLIGLDTSVNQYIMSNPAYLFERCVEQAVVDADNPFVATGHLRCATQELPLPERSAEAFGRHADLALEILEGNHKVKKIGTSWYHAAGELPQHDISLRSYADANVLIEEAGTGRVLGEINRFDAEPIVHPEAIYMHRGETYRVLNLDLDKNVATVKREEVDYYTQPLGGTDIHHIDRRLREKAFGTGRLYWGEVTAYFRTFAYEKIHFYSLDAISVHGLELPTMVLETMAFWLVPPEDLMGDVRRAGLDAHGGLRGIGYATRMLLPLFLTCDTSDFSHTVGSVNSPWNAVFVYERYPHGLGFTEKAYQNMHRILPAVLDNVKTCPCEQGCPSCVGKPLRQFSTWNVERGEASIPGKAAAIMILEGVLADGSALDHADDQALTDTDTASRQRLQQALCRRLERMREPQVFHPITPEPCVRTGYPAVEPETAQGRADVAERAARRRRFERELHKRIAKHIGPDGLRPLQGKPAPPRGMKTREGNLRPTDFPGRPDRPRGPRDQGARKPASPAAGTGEDIGRNDGAEEPSAGRGALVLGDALVARARKLYKRRKASGAHGET